jgi:deoxyribodipyrimidine photo-lyase
MPKRAAPTDSTTRQPSTKRAKQIDESTPYEKLKELVEGQETNDKVTKVLHWFRNKDLRIEDNKALRDASETAQEAKAPLICVYQSCTAEYISHGTSPARLDFVFETLKLMQAELKKLDIPLVFLESAKSADIVSTLNDFVKENEISHVFANYEYEIDELRRDIKFLKSTTASQVSFRHDQCIMEPGTIVTGAGSPMKVFTPYHQAWLSEVRNDPSLLDVVPAPTQNPSSVSEALKSLFDSGPPKLPKEKQFSSKALETRIRKLWPAGHAAAVERLDNFLKKKIHNYAETRSNPAKDSTSRLSVYLASGAISIREVLTAVREHNNPKNSTNFTETSCPPGIYSWVRELVFRELYRQHLVTTPHMSMNLPQNLKYTFVKWDSDATADENYKKWEEGTTGFPLVDAGMRQLAHECYMHNRARMNVSSFLYTNLFLDPRCGERYFMNTLIDGDLANNMLGWEPSYTVFNPVSQAERNDPDGKYIRKWVPELKGVEGKAVFAPFERLSKKEFEKLGYPKPCVDWKETKASALERFKKDMGGVQL